MSASTATERPRKRTAFALGAAGDERLAALVADGNERAFATIYSRYHQRLYRYCLTMVRNEADAQDALQSAFTSAFTALSESRRNAPLRPWLFRIAHNEAISLLRRRRPESALSELTELEDIGVEEQADRRVELQTLISDLRELPDRQRAALVMRELSGLSHEEIALALDVSAGSAKQTIFEARRSLMEFAAGRELHCEEIRQTISDGDGRAARARRVRGHLSTCAGCSAFADQIRRRRTTLRAIAPPLPALAAQQMLSRVLHAGGTHGGGTPVAAGAMGKLSAVALSTKAAAGVAVVVAGASVGGLLHHALQHAGPAAAQSQSARLASAREARSYSIGRAITVASQASRHAPVAGKRTAGQVHRLRDGFWAGAHGHGKPVAARGAASHAHGNSAAHSRAHTGGASGAHAHLHAGGSSTGATHRSLAGTTHSTHTVGKTGGSSWPASTIGTRTTPSKPSAPVTRSSQPGVKVQPLRPAKPLPRSTTSGGTTETVTSATTGRRHKLR
jgi:RNA polymerase sigma factor (sigma-70 family)